MEGKRVRWPLLEASRGFHAGGEGCVDEGEGLRPSCHMSCSDRFVEGACGAYGKGCKARRGGP